MKRIILTVLLGGTAVVIGGFLLIQLVPYGRAHDNPPVGREFQWPDDESRALAEKACFDCHSNETVWPAYSNVAPISWLVQHDVDEGREVLNFSEWGQGGEGESAHELAEVVDEGEMPPAIYLVLHPEARLTAAEKAALIQAFGGSSGGEGEHEEHEDEDD